MTLDTIIFVVSAVIAVFGATMMIVQRNPVASVLYFILSLLAQAVMYIQLGTVFMGAILVVVYAGAIMVLFIFVIMLLNLRGREDLGDGSPPLNRVTKYVFSILFVVEVVFAVRKGFFAETSAVSIMTQEVADSFGSVESTAMILFTRYLYPFELTAVLLLAAVVGAVAIAKRDTVAPVAPTDEAGAAGEQLPPKTDKVEG